jgi:hypothetical protein
MKILPSYYKPKCALLCGGTSEKKPLGRPRTWDIEVFQILVNKITVKMDSKQGHILYTEDNIEKREECMV